MKKFISTNKKKLIMMIAVCVVIFSAINVRISQSPNGNFSDITLAGIVWATGPGESGENGDPSAYVAYVQTKIETEKGRKTIFISGDSTYRNCKATEVTCIGQGDIFCVPATVYTDCNPL